MILEIVGAEVVWWDEVRFVREEQLNFIGFVIVMEATESFWIPTLMTLYQEFWNRNNIIWASLICEIVASWRSSFCLGSPIALG